MSVPYPPTSPLRARIAALLDSLSALLQAGCFWVAVTLPLCYPVLLGFGEFGSRSGYVVLAVLSLHLLALLGGRDYRAESIGR